MIAVHDHNSAAKVVFTWLSLDFSLSMDTDSHSSQRRHQRLVGLEKEKEKKIIGTKKVFFI